MLGRILIARVYGQRYRTNQSIMIVFFGTQGINKSGKLCHTVIIVVSDRDRLNPFLPIPATTNLLSLRPTDQHQKGLDHGRVTQKKV